MKLRGSAYGSHMAKTFTQTVSRGLIRSIRKVRSRWPIEAGKDFPNHIGAFLTRRGYLEPVWHEFQPGLWMRLDISDLIQETILLEDHWDPLLTRFLQERLTAGTVFIDIGANVGYFTLLGAMHVGAGGKVLAIEPNPAVATLLRENLARSELAMVIVEEVACCDSDAAPRLILYIPSDHNIAKASLSQRNAGPGTRVEVESTTVDRLVMKHGLTRVDLIKIDVEGAELGVFRGMKETLARFNPSVVTELDPELLASCGSMVEDVTDLMKSFGYKVSSMGGHGNYLFSPPLAPQYSSLGLEKLK